MAMANLMIRKGGDVDAECVTHKDDIDCIKHCTTMKAERIRRRVGQVDMVDWWYSVGFLPAKICFCQTSGLNRFKLVKQNTTTVVLSVLL